MAKSAQDGKLYRGKIMSKAVKDMVDVEYIDYGYTEKLQTSSLS